MRTPITHSIIIPTYNRPEQLRVSVASALEALGSLGEVIVVDDNSEVPASQSLASVFDKRLKIFMNTSGSGASAARNHGVNRALGRIIFFLDDDDSMQSGYCRKILKVREALPLLTWGYSSYIIKDNDGNKKFVQKHPGSGPISVDLSVKAKLGGLGMGFWIEVGTFRALGGLNNSLPIDEDTDLCLRLITSGAPAWFESSPGTIVSRDASTRLTSSTTTFRAAQAYAENAFQHGKNFNPLTADARFLYFRAIRLAAKSFAWRLGLGLCRSAGHPVLSIQCFLLLFLKGLSYAVRKLRSKIRLPN
jgi:glycosyltransferase involved in cell wall biosynthesis